VYRSGSRRHLQLPDRARESAVGRGSAAQRPFLALLLDLFARGPLAERPLPSAPPLVMAAMEAARRIWQVDGVRLITVGELARAARVSAGHLYRIFREHYGCGPAYALELIRLSRAAMMIQRSNASIVNVARASGFANAYHLSRRFSAACGVPPGKYRRDQSTSDPKAPVRTAGLHQVAYLLSPHESPRGPTRCLEPTNGAHRGSSAWPQFARPSKLRLGHPSIASRSRTA
jgi:AraC family transcriptional regulator